MCFYQVQTEKNAAFAPTGPPKSVPRAKTTVASAMEQNQKKTIGELEAALSAGEMHRTHYASAVESKVQSLTHQVFVCWLTRREKSFATGGNIEARSANTARDLEVV